MRTAYVITFKGEDDLIQFESLNSEFFAKNDERIKCFATISEPTLLSFDNFSIHYKHDSCYAEGWNNALEFFKNEIAMYDFIVFAGNGDKFLSYPTLHKADIIHIGRMKRGGVLRKNYLHNPALWFVNIGVWTPSVFWPTKMVLIYRFPEEYKIASDVDLFFTFKHNLISTLYIDDCVLDMDDNGMSMGNVGASEYRAIAENYHGKLRSMIGFIFKELRKLCRKF
jgi:hypothetical protein